MNRFLTAAAAAVALTLTATPVAAQDRYEVRIVYSDLDLSTQAGADRMFARIESAARNTCAVGGVTRRARNEERACATDFTRRALA
jgi:UrcA family protein